MKRALILLTIFLALSCKDDNPEIDKTAPEIDMFLPERYQVYGLTDTVFMVARFSDNRSLKTGAIHIHDQFLPSPSDTVFSYNFKTEKAELEIDTFWLPVDLKDHHYVIYFEGTDRAENHSQISRYFYRLQ